MYVNVWTCSIAVWNPSWSSHPLGIASISSSIVRKQTLSLICVAHCNKLAKYGQAFRKKRESPTSEFMTLGSACGLFLCMPEWHGNCSKSLWPVSTLSHLQLCWIFPFFNYERFFCLLCYLLTQANHDERHKGEQYALMKRGRMEKEQGEARSVAEWFWK